MRARVWTAGTDYALGCNLGILRVLNDAGATAAQLVLALDRLDRFAMHSVSQYSHADAARFAAATVKRVRADANLAATDYGREVIRRERLVGEKLDAMLDECAAPGSSEAREELIRRLLASGVRLVATHGAYCLGVASHYAVSIRAARGFRAAAQRTRAGLARADVAHCEAEEARIRAELSAAGIPGL